MKVEGCMRFSLIEGKVPKHVPVRAGVMCCISAVLNLLLPHPNIHFRIEKTGCIQKHKWQRDYRQVTCMFL